MNRWWGGATDSDKQANERNSRAARRIISQQQKEQSLILSSDEDDYADCDTSGIFGGLDGADELPEDMAAAELARQRALPVDESDFENDPESWKKELKLKFEPHDIHYWFNSVESQLKKYGINRQWDKKDAIVPLLPEEVVDEIKPLLRLTQAEVSDHIYKDIKTEIISLYGPREEDAFKKAMALKMSGKPSAFGKKLLHIICPGSKPLETCHCARMVFGFWEAQLSAPVKTKISGQPFNHATYQSIFKQADEAWLANGGSTSTPAVVAAVSTDTKPSDPNDAPQVSAVQRGGGRGRGPRNRGNRGNGRGTYNNNSNRSNEAQNTNTNNSNSSNSTTNTNAKPHQRGTKHPDLPKNAGWACAQHWKKGRGAPYCSDPLVCQWVNVVAPRQ